MRNYPLGRWSVNLTSVGASVWIKKISEGKGGGYYLYEWVRGADRITVRELLEGTTQDERRDGKRSVYVSLEPVPVPEELHGWDQHQQELGVARLIHTGMIERFGAIAEWIPYGSDGSPVWFHDEIMQENSHGI